MNGMEGIYHPHPNPCLRRGRDFILAHTAVFTGAGTLSLMPEGEGTLRLWAADGGVFAFGGEGVGEDECVVGGGGLG